MSTGHHRQSDPRETDRARVIRQVVEGVEDEILELPLIIDEDVFMEAIRRRVDGDETEEEIEELVEWACAFVQKAQGLEAELDVVEY